MKLSLCNEAHYNLFLHTRSTGRVGDVGMLIHNDLPHPSISPILISYDCYCYFYLVESFHPIQELR